MNWVDALPLAFLDISPVELLVIAGVALMLFGEKLPTMARSFGKGFSEFKRSMNDASSEFQKEMYAAAEAAEEQRRRAEAAAAAMIEHKEHQALLHDPTTDTASTTSETANKPVDAGELAGTSSSPSSEPTSAGTPEGSKFKITPAANTVSVGQDINPTDPAKTTEASATTPPVEAKPTVTLEERLAKGPSEKVDPNLN